jgi:hypothetical protein
MMKSVEVQLTITAIIAANLTSGGLSPLMVTDCRNKKTSETMWKMERKAQNSERKSK